MESQGSKREKTLFSFFKPRESASTSEGHSPSNVDISNHQPPLSKSRRVEIDLSTLERDPGIRIPIWQHPVNQRDEIRRAYIKMGPYQPKLAEYRRTNQIGNLHRSGATRWSSHFDSICSLIDMYGATISVLESIIEEGSSNSMRGEAGGCLMIMRSFEFIFTLYMMHKIMGITDLLCKALQHKSLDIVNAMDLVSTTKALLFTLREEGFDHLLVHVQSICRQNDIDIPDMNASYKRATGRSCQQKDSMTVCQHYHFDVFNSAIDFQHEELNSKFSDGAVELLILSSALEPKDNFKSFKVDDICKLAEKFYPEDFSEQEMHYLRCQLNHYKIDVLHHKSFQNMSTMTELCRGLVETKRAFSAMKHVKTALRNKMEEEFLADSMMIYIERELVEDIDSDSIIDEFYSTKHRRLQLK
ncbi:uncharacterized protein LOC119982737 isoform X1 [Tripterygium wilfordii]|uniref:uncharacterized protein LOC119982737 isoform X1 n=1 Tax=Tripterygium wilfordii TaxID=458696 RepID=UPI0018F7E739|nr:uncharacterized protein LOC119982737 isoform X1 [Tripterygium wilfordii]